MDNVGFILEVGRIHDNTPIYLSHFGEFRGQGSTCFITADWNQARVIPFEDVAEEIREMLIKDYNKNPKEVEVKSYKALANAS